MVEIITVASQKGGVGKTTTTLNLGFSLTQLGSRVLLVDTDPQGGLAHTCNLRSKAQGGLLQVLRQELTAADVITRSRDARLAVVGTGVDNPAAVLELESASQDGALGELILGLATDFEYVVIDAPAGIGSFVQRLLAVSHSLVAPLSCRALSVRSLPTLLQTVQHVAQANPALKLHGLLLTMFSWLNKGDVELRRELRGRLPPGSVFDTEIPFDAGIETASERSLPASLVPEAQRAAKSYMNLALELRSRRASARTGDADADGALGLF